MLASISSFWILRFSFSCMVAAERYEVVAVIVIQIFIEELLLYGGCGAMSIGNGNGNGNSNRNGN